MNIILLDPTEVDDRGAVGLTDGRARHLKKVLRVEPGRVVKVGLANGPLGVGEVRSVEDGAVELVCRFDAEARPRPTLDLVLAIPRPKVLRRLYGAVAAFGVDRLILLRSWRVERPYLMSTVLTPNVYDPLLRDGVMQGGHTALPVVSIEPRFVPFVEERAEALASVRLVAHPGSAETLRSIEPPKPADRVVVAVGPEGGWVASELRSFERAGFVPLSLTTPILKVETAVISLLAQLALVRA